MLMLCFARGQFIRINRFAFHSLWFSYVDLSIKTAVFTFLFLSCLSLTLVGRSSPSRISFQNLLQFGLSMRLYLYIILDWGHHSSHLLLVVVLCCRWLRILRLLREKFVPLQRQILLADLLAIVGHASTRCRANRLKRLTWLHHNIVLRVVLDWISLVLVAVSQFYLGLLWTWRFWSSLVFAMLLVSLLTSSLNARDRCVSIGQCIERFAVLMAHIRLLLRLSRIWNSVEFGIFIFLQIWFKIWCTLPYLRHFLTLIDFVVGLRIVCALSNRHWSADEFASTELLVLISLLLLLVLVTGSVGGRFVHLQEVVQFLRHIGLVNFLLRFVSIWR